MWRFVKKDPTYDLRQRLLVAAHAVDPEVHNEELDTPEKIIRELETIEYELGKAIDGLKRNLAGAIKGGEARSEADFHAAFALKVRAERRIGETEIQAARRIGAKGFLFKGKKRTLGASGGARKAYHHGVAVLKERGLIPE